MLVILFLNRIYYTSHLDIVSYPLVALHGMILTLLVSSVSFFSFFVVNGVPMFVFATWINKCLYYFIFYFLVFSS